ncbi:MAG: TOBE domain-containing protein, partial [Blastocatellia bacterium]
AGTVSGDITDPHGECKVEAPVGNYREHEHVTLAIRSGDILLATERLEHTSARNNLPGRITGLERRSDRTLVRVLAGVEWIVRVTEQAVEELKLENGRPVWLAFKTHSCYVLDREHGGL